VSPDDVIERVLGAVPLPDHDFVRHEAAS
jgi:hypothetical protein